MTLEKLDKQLNKVRDAAIATGLAMASQEEATKLGKRILDAQESLKIAEMQYEAEKKRLSLLKDVDISKPLKMAEDNVNYFKNEINDARIAIKELGKYFDDKKKLTDGDAAGGGSGTKGNKSKASPTLS